LRCQGKGRRDLKPSKARTFRIEVDLDTALEEIAREERISMNQVANKALRKYVEWDKAPTNRGMVSVPSMLMVKLMAGQTEAKAHELGRWAGRELFLPNLKAGYATLSMERVERLVRMLGEYGGRFTFDHRVSEGKHVITVGQKLGRNWSVYYAGAMETIFGGFLGNKVTETISDNMCVLEFET
jgi:hypothetical protein